MPIARGGGEVATDASDVAEGRNPFAGDRLALFGLAKRVYPHRDLAHRP